MNVLVVGSGAREHALCRTLARDPEVVQVVCAPGNAGLAREFRTTAVDLTNPAAILALAELERADLTVVGPELPLGHGVVDAFAPSKRPIFGPCQAAARLETSKAFAKEFMARHGVPTARYRICTDANDALSAIRRGDLGPLVVVKADGLAAGKGVVVADSVTDAENAVKAAMVDRAFGDAGSAVVLEERLEGPEVSFFVIADGERFVPLVAAQDHKRIFDDDRGPNTGGMGAFAPTPLVDDALSARIGREVVSPVLRGLAAEGAPYRGVLYCGLMLTGYGPKVIEFNVRFGDPEAQVVLPMIAEPLSRVLLAAATGALPETPLRMSAEPHVGLVLAAHGYPGDVRSGDRIVGLDRLAEECPDVLTFFAGVKTKNGDLVTSGGRVMTLVGKGPTFESAIATAYAGASRVSFEGMQFRRDIGRKALR